MKSKNIYFLLALAAITLIVFGKVIGFEFLTFDDNIYIYENYVIADQASTFKECILYQFQQPNYFPLSNLVFRTERILFGLNPSVFHGVNLLIYLINVLLVFALSLKVFSKTSLENTKIQFASFCVALFFAIHPLHVESVAWAIDLKDLLFSMFYLSGLLVYWRWLETNKIQFIALAVILSLLSLLSKSTGITFIAALFLVDWINQNKLSLKSILVKIPFVFVAFFGLYIFGILGNASTTMNGFSGDLIKEFNVYYPAPIDQMGPFIQRLFIAMFRIVFWFSQTIFPQNQTVMYDRDQLLLLYENAVWIIPIFIIILIVWAIIKRRSFQFMFFGLGFYFITILPALAQSDIGLAVFTPDRYMYLPILGLLFVLVGLIMMQHKWVTRAIIVTLVIFWGIKTVVYLPNWKSSETLYQSILEKDPNCQVALLNRSMIHIEKGENDKAMDDLNKLAELGSPMVGAYLNRGKIYMDNGKLDDAMNDFNTALKIDSTCFDAYLKRGALNIRIKDYEKSRSDLSIAYEMDSTNYLLNKNIANLYLNVENYPVALTFCDKCIAMKPNDIDVLKLKAKAHFYLKDFSNCEKALSLVLEKDSKNGSLWYMRSLSRMQQLNYQGAYNDYLKAKEFNIKIDENFEKHVLRVGKEVE